jgi:hypothetical protein
MMCLLKQNHWIHARRESADVRIETRKFTQI